MKVGIVAKLKQGDLLAAMIKRGWTQKRLGEHLGMSQGAVGKLLNLEWVPMEFSVDLELKLFELTGKTSEELFPAVLRQREWLKQKKTYHAFRNVSPEILRGTGIFALPSREMRAVGEISRELLQVLDELPERIREILVSKYSGMSDEEVAEEEGLSSERVRQLHTRGIKYLRQICMYRGIKP